MVCLDSTGFCGLKQKEKNDKLPLSHEDSKLHKDFFVNSLCLVPLWQKIGLVKKRKS